MSQELMVRVLKEAELTRPQQAVLVAMAENAWDDGTHCFPSVDLIAWKAGYKPRNVIDIIRQLRQMGVLEEVRGAAGRRATEYVIHLDQAPRKQTFEEWQMANGRHAERAKRDPAGVQSHVSGVQSRVQNSRETAPVQSREGCNLTSLGVQSHVSGVQSRVQNSRETAPRTVREPSLTVRKDTETASAVSPSADAEDDRPPTGGEVSPGRTGQRFERFWAACPRKVGKEAARRWWYRHKPDEALTARMIDTLERQKASPDWLRDGGAFIPHPATWLNRGGWEDELGPAVSDRDSVYVAAFGEANITQLAAWLDGLDPMFAGPGWVRRTLRTLAVDVPGLSPQQLKAGMAVGYERIEARFRNRDKPVTNPTTFALFMFRDALDEQRVTT